MKFAPPENPLPSRDFMRELRRAAGIPVKLPATKLMLEAGAVAGRPETQRILEARRVIAGRGLERGFSFEFSVRPAAAHELCADRRAGVR